MKSTCTLLSGKLQVDFTNMHLTRFNPAWLRRTCNRTQDITIGGDS